MSNRPSNAFTPYDEREERTIARLYRQYGKDALAERLGRSPRAIKERAYEIGAMAEPAKPWTPEEIQILLDHYEEEGRPGVAPMLPGRSVGAIKRKVRDLGLRRGKWDRAANWNNSH